MFLELYFVLASATQEPSRFGTLAKADQCAKILGDPSILERHVAKTKAAGLGMGFSEAEIDALTRDNLAEARAANLPAPTEEECLALK